MFYGTAKALFRLFFSSVFFFISVSNLLTNFGIALTYDLFITLGLITSVPVSAGKKLVII